MERFKSAAGSPGRPVKRRNGLSSLIRTFLTCVIGLCQRISRLVVARIWNKRLPEKSFLFIGKFHTSEHRLQQMGPLAVTTLPPLYTTETISSSTELMNPKQGLVPMECSCLFIGCPPYQRYHRLSLPFQQEPYWTLLFRARKIRQRRTNLSQSRISSMTSYVKTIRFFAWMALVKLCWCTIPPTMLPDPSNTTSETMYLTSFSQLRRRQKPTSGLFATARVLSII